MYQNKENGAAKEKNGTAVRRNIQFFSGLSVDYALFYFILAVDAALTAEIFLRSRFGAKVTVPSG